MEIMDGRIRVFAVEVVVPTEVAAWPEREMLAYIRGEAARVIKPYQLGTLGLEFIEDGMPLVRQGTAGPYLTKVLARESTCDVLRTVVA